MLPAPSVFSALLTESSPLPQNTCGVNLEYTPHFLDFINSARGKPEQQIGKTVIAAQEPDWRNVLKSGMALGDETRDLRVAVVLAQAAIELYGLRGLADGLALIADWLTHHWETLHPTLEADGEHDPLIRTNALAYLYAPHTCLKAVRKACLLKSRIGDISISAADNIISGQIDSETAPVSTPEQLARLITDEQAANADTFAALGAAHQHQHAIETLWKSKLDAEYWPEFDNLRSLLERISRLIAAPAQTATPWQENAAKNTAPTAPIAQMLAAQNGGATAVWPSSIESRREAFQILALVRQYFEHHEPSHPAPILISRIEKLETLDFAAIIAELTPDGIGQLQQIAGQQT